LTYQTVRPPVPSPKGRVGPPKKRVAGLKAQEKSFPVSFAHPPKQVVWAITSKIQGPSTSECPHNLLCGQTPLCLQVLCRHHFPWSFIFDLQPRAVNRIVKLPDLKAGLSDPIAGATPYLRERTSKLSRLDVSVSAVKGAGAKLLPLLTCRVKCSTNVSYAR